MGDPVAPSTLAKALGLDSIRSRLRNVEKPRSLTLRSLVASLSLRSPGVRTTTVIDNPVPLYIDASGTFGISASTREKKIIGTDYRVDMTSFLAIVLKNWAYIDNPASVGMGPIANDLHEAGLTEFVIYNPVDGSIMGVNTDTLVMGLWSAYLQSREVSMARIATLEKAQSARLHQVFEYVQVGALTVLASQRDLTISWPKPFADTDYTITAGFTPPAGVLIGLSYFVKSKTATGCVITIYTNGVALPAGGLMTVDANHL